MAPEPFEEGQKVTKESDMQVFGMTALVSIIYLVIRIAFEEY